MNKAQFISKISCTLHEDRTPSLAVYSDGSGYCFSCNKYFKDIGEKHVDGPVPVPEDIKTKITYIQSLPLVSHRGLSFPYDDIGYYILWPEASYYKCRRWLPGDSGNKYSNPSGISQPWFNYNSQPSLTAIIIEGEINAMSIKLARPDLAIYCPGSAGQFKLNKSGSLQEFKQHATIALVADKDSAGLNAVIKLKNELIDYCPDVVIKLLTKPNDYNQVLIDYGREKLKEEINSLGV